jgi:uncharacterized membrane protein YbhN (UPF0104 family)
VQAAVAVLVMILAGIYLARQWEGFRDQAIDWQPRPCWLVLAVTLVWVAYAILVEGWRRVVLSMRQQLSYREAVRVCMVSNLGKYLPGKVWAIAGAAWLAGRAGVDAGVAVASALILQALALASGLVMVAALAPQAILSLGTGARVALIVVALMALGALMAFIVPGLLTRVRPWLPAALRGLAPVAPQAMLVGFTANLVAWGLYGLAFLALAQGLVPAPAMGWTESTAVFATSYLVGLIAALAPGGLGPREFVFVLLLSPTLGPKLAVALAVASRLLLTVTELGAALPFLPALRRALRDP